MPVFSQAAQGPRQFPPGSIQQTSDLPPSRFRFEIERLPAEARDRALAWLREFHFPEADLNSMRVDDTGSVFYEDAFPVPAQGFDAPAPAATASAAAAPLPASPFPAALVFHSKPGSPNTFFLNFSGERVTNTAWNTSLNRTVIPAVGLDIDGDPTTWNDTEQSLIKRVWQRVSEDYACFDIDVTTERPATFTTRTAHALITRSTDSDGQPNPSSGAGGVAYINVFASATYATYRPGWIYYDNLGNAASYIAEAVSHEIGHNMGLSHDGQTTAGVEYYQGHGSGDTSWAPIMGVGYYANVSQWSKGEYYLANNTEDDLAIISAKLSYRVDDRGNTIGSATPLKIIEGAVIATDPETDPTNTNPANKGIIERGTDVDVFSFVTGTGPVNLGIVPWIMTNGPTRGGNLDISVELRDAAGNVLLTNNPASATWAVIQTNLTEGSYYVFVRNSGAGNPLSSTPTGFTAYGSLGQYYVTGTVVSSTLVIPPVAALSASDIQATRVPAETLTVTYSGSGNTAIDVATIDSGDIRVSGPNGFNRLARFLLVNNNANGTPRVATYAVDPPNGVAWTELDNGTYSVFMQSNQVADVTGTSVPAAQIGQFTVNVPHVVYFAGMDTNPGWTLEPLWQYGKPAYAGAGPGGGYTGTNIIGYNLSGNYENRLAFVYATTPAMDCSSLASVTLRFRRWLDIRSGDTAVLQASTNGTSWTDVWSTTNTVNDNSWQDVQYVLPTWTARSPSVRLRWGLSSNTTGTDLGWNLDDVELSGGLSHVTNAAPAALAAELTAQGACRIRLQGVAGGLYRVEYTEDFFSPTWQELGTQTADGQGVLQIVDAAPGAIRFYRAVSLQAP